MQLDQLIYNLFRCDDSAKAESIKGLILGELFEPLPPRKKITSDRISQFSDSSSDESESEEKVRDSQSLKIKNSYMQCKVGYNTRRKPYKLRVNIAVGSSSLTEVRCKALRAIASVCNNHKFVSGIFKMHGLSGLTAQRKMFTIYLENDADSVRIASLIRDLNTRLEATGLEPGNQNEQSDLPLQNSRYVRISMDREFDASASMQYHGEGTAGRQNLKEWMQLSYDYAALNHALMHGGNIKAIEKQYTDKQICFALERLYNRTLMPMAKESELTNDDKTDQFSLHPIQLNAHDKLSDGVLGCVIPTHSKKACLAFSSKQYMSLNKSKLNLLS